MKLYIKLGNVNGVGVDSKFLTKREGFLSSLSPFFLRLNDNAVILIEMAQIIDEKN
jgi:hypothetical protein